MIDLTAKIQTLSDSHKTHMDLYYAGARSSDHSLITRCVLLDISHSPEKADLDALSGLHLIEKGHSVIFKTGWEHHRGTPKYDESQSIDKGLIEHLVALGVILMLVDSPGIYGGVAGPEHNEMDKYLADNQAHAVENLVNLDLLDAVTFRLYCFPIYSSATNTAPCRVLADLGSRVEAS